MGNNHGALNAPSIQFPGLVVLYTALRELWLGFVGFGIFVAGRGLEWCWFLLRGWILL
jgi:hypothetical protein